MTTFSVMKVVEEAGDSENAKSRTDCDRYENLRDENSLLKRQ